jgi:Ca2+:H+ antiporter
LIPLVKATLIGALISNSALIMGLCSIAAGLTYGRPRFRREEAGHHAVLMMLTVAAVLFPSAGSLVACGLKGCGPGGPDLFNVSLGVAIVLLLAYVAYVVYGILGFERLRRIETDGRQARRFKQQAEAEPERGWPLGLSLAILAIATLCLIPVTDILTGSVGPVTDRLGWTQVFVGMIIVANAGNMAEAYAAIRMAILRPPAPDPEKGEDSGLDLALGIASASSIQIATFVMPLIVLYSLTGQHMDLVFSPVELSILGLLVVIYAYMGQDGESNWLEGAELIALYAMAAIIFYSLPVSVFQ